MADHQLHLEQDFFLNNNPQEEPFLPLPNEDNHPQIKNYDTNATHTQGSPPDPEAPSSSNRFYQEYRRIYSVSYNLQTEKERLAEVLNDLNERLQNLQGRLVNVEGKGKQVRHVQTKNEQQSQQSKNKRARRTAQQIEKKFKCEVTYCERFYGSEGSLQQHIKLKHPHLLRHSSQEEYLPNQRDKIDLSSN